MLIRKTYGLIALICILTLTSMPTFAQSSIVDNFYVVNDNGIMGINRVNGKQNTKISLASNLAEQSTQNSPDTILDAKIDRSTQLLYVVRGPIVMSDTTPKLSRIEQINLTTGTSQVIYERQAIFNVNISPGGSQAIVSYYEGEILFSPLHMCVLLIAKGTCIELDLTIHSTFSIHWLDENSVTVQFGGNKLYEIDTNTQQITLLKGLENWYIESTAPIPLTRTLLVAATPSIPNGQLNPVHLLLYETDTGNVTDYAYQINSADTAYLAPDLELSPNGQYFMVGTYGTRRIVEFKTGRIVTELAKVSQVAWSSDNVHALISQTTSETNDTVTSQILNLDLQNGLSTSVLSTTDPGFLVAP